MTRLRCCVPFCNHTKRADERIPDLLATPAAVRWISAEPLLGPVNLRRIRIAPDHHTIVDALDGYAITDSISGSGAERAQLDWVVVGGESGSGARPMHQANHPATVHLTENVWKVDPHAVTQRQQMARTGTKSSEISSEVIHVLFSWACP